ncbi:hypothetical protein CSKR_109068 [Clonorchis sinensis]|uniref:Shisa N-terminal domain-containing protein n=1 Tax=Clonorchis sinensis TaxID=79923 RepID=A0A419PV06_CLOSI|nr:hypothetical protein CSKR_109068 [Clonorchis sinensis]
MEDVASILLFTLPVLLGLLGRLVSTQKSTVPDIPNEVLRRYGGLTMKQKRELYSKYQSLQFVDIPEFLKPQITSIEVLERFGVCKMPGQSGQVQTSYFVCPKLPPTGTATGEEEKRYCCGPVTQQFCCSAAEFTAGVRIISPAQVVSPSVIIGASLAFLLVATLLTIIAYSRIARGLRKQSSRMQCQANSSSSYPAHRGYSSKNSLSSSHIPPSKQLISNKGISSSVEKQVEVKQTRLPNENKEALNPKQPPALRLLTGDTVPHPTKQTVSARPAKKQPYNRRSRT